MKICLVLEVKNAASFIKTLFYRKRGCLKTRTHAETFHSNKGCKLSFLYHSRRFQNRNLGCNFQTLLARKRGLAHPFFLYENESLQHYPWEECLRRMLFEKNDNLFNPWGPVFLSSPFFLRSWVPVLVRFFDDAQNDEQFQKLKKQSAHIKIMMAVFSHLDRILC